MMNTIKLNNALIPLVYALALFICVRLVLDVPEQSRFWELPLAFAIETMLIALLIAYVAFAFIRYWAKRTYKLKKNGRNLIHIYGVPLFSMLTFLGIVVFITSTLSGRPAKIADACVPAVIGVLFAFSYYHIIHNKMIEGDLIKERLQLEQMKNDKLQTELKFLRSQYHPHFLFNALDTVYSQIEETDNVPRHTLEMLSDLLRYQLYGGTETVAIRQEIEYLKTYIRLQSLRKSERLTLNTHFSSMLADQQIYPLLFLPLVENAFKYVGGEYNIDMIMEWKGGKVILEIVNSIAKEMERKQTGRGIGLENLRRRLSLLYPGKHIFKVDKTNNKFIVILIIETDK